MASPSLFIICISIFLTWLPSTITAQVSLPVLKDPATLQFYTTVRLGSPPATFPAVVDLGGQTLWINCDIYNSSTYRHVHCNTPECNFLNRASGCRSCNGPLRPGCAINSCTGASENPFRGILYSAGILSDSLLIGSRNIRGFTFDCSSPSLMEGLSTKAQGMLGLGTDPMAAPAQLSSALKITKTFSVCLPASSRAAGSLVFGGLSSKHSPELLSTTTPLLNFPVPNVLPSQEYYIGVKSIRVDDQTVEIDAGLLELKKDGSGGTRISTVTKYTTLHTNIYGPLVRAFEKQASKLYKMKKVAAVAPFEKCYSSKSVAGSISGPGVPLIDLVLQSSEVYWRIHGANSMVEVSKDVMCLGLVDGGSRTRLAVASVVLGAHQLQDILLEFDLRAKTLKFSSALVLHNTGC